MNEGEGLRIDRLQRDILMPQLESFLAAAPDAEARAPYLAVRAALDEYEIPPELTERVGAIAEVLLTTGRVRHLYGPGAELSLWSLFQKTPRGRDIARSIESANAALKRVAGGVFVNTQDCGIADGGPIRASRHPARKSRTRRRLDFGLRLPIDRSRLAEELRRNWRHVIEADVFHPRRFSPSFLGIIRRLQLRHHSPSESAQSPNSGIR